MKYFAFLLNVRSREADYLFQMGRLFQEFCIFGRMVIDNSRLMYQLSHQKELRAEKYSSLRDEVMLRRREGMEVNEAVGKRIVLSPSFEGGKRKWNLRYQNGMAIVRHFCKPDIFLTYTFPPNTPELLAELRPGQCAQVLKQCNALFGMQIHKYTGRIDLIWWRDFLKSRRTFF